MFTQSIEMFLDEIKSWNCYEDYVPKVEAFIENYSERTYNSYDPNSDSNGSYNVLNHGDHYTKNMMFKIKNDRVEDVCFVSRILL
jgi:hypothetical protein